MFQLGLHNCVSILVTAGQSRDGFQNTNDGFQNKIQTTQESIEQNTNDGFQNTNEQTKIHKTKGKRRNHEKSRIDSGANSHFCASSFVN